MDGERMEFTLPPAPKGLCFDRNDFVKTHFSVDIFLSEHQNVVSLEVMRDDLGLYLKVLRLAMIELINRDYANFVNLSATLIGFDKAIEKIQHPLKSLNEEVLNVKICLEEAMKELSMWLSQKNSLHNKKQSLKHYSQTLNSLATLQDIINNIEKDSIKGKLELTDRGVLHYNQLKFSINKCPSLIKPEHKSKFNDLGNKLINILNRLLIEFWIEQNSSNLLKVFIALASLDKVNETEILIRKQIISPLLQDVINEASLQRSEDGLKSIYTKILSLLENKLKMLLLVLQDSKLSVLSHRYRFVVNCFWCEVESRLEVNLSSIFAPGNPKIFYSRYNESMQFMKNLESFCSEKDDIALLHGTQEYKSFLKRWNLPVYFQIRFQEIAGAFEAVLQNCPNSTTDSMFILKETHICWVSLQKCWEYGVYIEALAHKFWKLTLQILSRYASWVNLCADQKSSCKADVTIDKDLVHNSVNLHLDTQKLLQQLPKFIEMVEKKIPITNRDLLRNSLEPTTDSLKETQKNIKNCIVNELFDRCNGHLKQVSDIPRLYRKTNRSIPSKPCAYVESIAKTIQEFSKEVANKLDYNFLKELYESLFNILTNSFHKSVEDVLVSVQKTEDSLRRLKQIREGTPQQMNEGITDGDKIRLQLHLDVKTYINIAASLQINVNNISNMNNINIMVTDAVKSIVDIK